MIGEPSETPSTGPPAPTSDHHPIAFTRSLGGNDDMMSAIDAVPVAAPCTPSSVRARMSSIAVGASAVSTRGDHRAEQPDEVEAPVPEDVARPCRRAARRARRRAAARSSSR